MTLPLLNTEIFHPTCAQAGCLENGGYKAQHLERGTNQTALRNADVIKTASAFLLKASKVSMSWLLE